MSRFLFIVALGFCLAAGTTRADDAASEQLALQLQALGQLQGDFEQKQYTGESGELVSTSKGRFRLLRPGFFAWEINSPDSQLIIADLKHLWHYDRDLETVTRRPVSGREEMSPLQVLGGDTDVLKQRFDVSAQGDGRYLLIPTTGNPGFKSLLLNLQGEAINGMEIVDNLNQRLVIDFSSDGFQKRSLSCRF